MKSLITQLEHRPKASEAEAAKQLDETLKFLKNYFAPN